MGNFGISGIWLHPKSTIPAVLAGLTGIAVALGWMDQATATQICTVIGSVLVAVVGMLYKGPKPV